MRCSPNHGALTSTVQENEENTLLLFLYPHSLTLQLPNVIPLCRRKHWKSQGVRHGKRVGGPPSFREGGVSLIRATVNPEPSTKT